MNPRLTGALLCALALCVALPAAAPAASPFARVKVAQCDITDDPDQSSGVFEGRMNSIKGSQSMWMRFTLQERFETPVFEIVKVPSLSVWRKSRSGVDRFTYRQKIEKLQMGGEYRARVDFRWYGSKGQLLRTARRHSPACGHQGPLPNLRVGNVRARFGKAPGTYDYTVDVLNLGDLAAENVPVSLTVDGATLDEHEVNSLAPGETATVRFSGPPCERGIEARADATDAVRETSELDNVVMLPCSQLASGR